MDRGKVSNKLSATVNMDNLLYMNLKEIIRESALKFLPAKSLTRFSVVCRDWKLQIRSPFFAYNQSNSFRATGGIFVQSPWDVPSFISLDPTACGVPDPHLSFLPEPVDIRSSSNGLVCCQGRSGYKAYYICNPVTKQWKKLPKPEANHGSDPAVVLIFKPSVFDFSAKYKLVCAFESELDGYEFEIYSSEKDAWTTSREIRFSNSTKKLLSATGVHADTTVYWQSHRGIIAYDVEIDRSQEIPWCNGKLGARNGRLCLSNMKDNVLSIYVLCNTHGNTMQSSNYVSAWKAVSTEVLSDVPADLTSLSYYAGGRTHSRVAFCDGEVAVVWSGSFLYAYDLKKKTTLCLGQADAPETILGYVNSLVEL